jgi:hypothetical protein
MGCKNAGILKQHWDNLNDWRKDPTVIIIIETTKKSGAPYTGIAWLKVSKADTVTLNVVNEAADILTKACPQVLYDILYHRVTNFISKRK